MRESVKRKPELSADSATVDEFAAALAEAAPEADGFNLVAEELRTVTGAKVVSISSYDSAAGELVVKHLAPSGRLLASLNRLLGRDIIGMRMRVPPGMLDEMISKVVSPAMDVSTLTFGAIPDPVGALIHEVLRLGTVKALLLNYGEEIIGTVVIVMRHGQKPLPDDILYGLARVAAVMLHRQRAETNVGD
jgi:hypothetical protein